MEAVNQRQGSIMLAAFRQAELFDGFVAFKIDDEEPGEFLNFADLAFVPAAEDDPLRQLKQAIITGLVSIRKDGLDVEIDECFFEDDDEGSPSDSEINDLLEKLATHSLLEI